MTVVYPMKTLLCRPTHQWTQTKRESCRRYHDYYMYIYTVCVHTCTLNACTFLFCGTFELYCPCSMSCWASLVVVHVQCLCVYIATLSCDLWSCDRAQRRRSQFRQYYSEESILRKTTEFVENYLHSPEVWKFDKKEKNLLTSEVQYMYYIVFGSFHIISTTFLGDPSELDKTCTIRGTVYTITTVHVQYLACVIRSFFSVFRSCVLPGWWFILVSTISPNYSISLACYWMGWMIEGLNNPLTCTV